MLKNLLRKQKLAESGNIEFKPAFQWDSRVMQEDKDLRFDFLLKPVAAFLNASGGTLFIGVNDDGSACGIAGDLALFKDSPNRLELEMMQLISSKIGPIHSGSVRIQIEPLNPTGQDFVCIVDVDAAPRPAFVKWGNSVYFFKRAGNKSEPLGPIDQHDYIQSRWG
jgi:predicted HTH transcriptional regulator